MDSVGTFISMWGVRVLGAIAVLVFGWMAAGVIRGFVRRALDRTTLDPTLIPFISKLVYYAVNKPTGFLSTNADPRGRQRVIDLVPNSERVFPVGRLDQSSQGLMLLTNDGDLAQQLSHPKYGVRKVYRVTVAGKIDGETFEGGADNNSQLVLGSNTFIPGFEDQLIGMKAGDEGEVKVSFPEDYPAEHLAGKDAIFDVHVHEVAKPGKTEINDEFAKTLGLDDLDKLKEVVRDQISGQYEAQTRQKVKRQLLDELDKKHKFDLPEGMVEQEFNNIWAQITKDLEEAGKTFKDEDTTEAKAKKEYQKLAERRVRLGLVLAEIGEKAKVEITEDELQRALYEQVRQYPGQEKEIYEFFRSNPDAVGSLRAPIFEEKVVDHILESAAVKDKKVTAEELMKDDELPE